MNRGNKVMMKMPNPNPLTLWMNAAMIADENNSAMICGENSIALFFCGAKVTAKSDGGK